VVVIMSGVSQAVLRSLSKLKLTQKTVKIRQVYKVNENYSLLGDILYHVIILHWIQ